MRHWTPRLRIENTKDQWLMRWNRIKRRSVFRWWVIGLLGGFLFIIFQKGFAAEGTIHVTISRHGTLTFTTISGYTNYTVEWAPTPNGPWHQSWECLKKIHSTGPEMTVQIPMFFRVVAVRPPVKPPVGMVYVPEGSFLMGDERGIELDALPVHRVTVQGFFMDRFEVTKALWDEVRNWALLHGYEIAEGSAPATNHPVSEITWYDAVKWCNARSEKEGLKPVYYTDESHQTVYRTGWIDLKNEDVDWEAEGYRLPTEAEWERAVRGGQEGNHFPWPSPGDDWRTQIQEDQANFWNSGDPFDNGTTPVGFYNGHQSVHGKDMANEYGLYDMAGNVLEMCWDRFGSYPEQHVENPKGPDQGLFRVERGGSWYDNPDKLRCASRRAFAPGSRGPQRGFRCVRSVTR